VNTTIGTDIGYAAELLRSGEVVGVPTETVYGLAANALSADAVIKIFEAKNRPFFDPLIVHIKDVSEAEKYVQEIPVWALQLAEKFSPGPITFLLRKKDIIPDIVTSGLERVGIRIPAHPTIQALLEEVEFPLAAPSANPFGYISPTTAQHVYDQLQDRIPYILDGGACSVGIESTIIGEEDGNLIIYRLGGISVEDIEKETGKVELRTSSSKPSTPGALDIHYSPKSKLRVVTYTDVMPKSTDGYLSFQRYITHIPKEHQRILSETGNINEAAINLFKYMRELDALEVDTIYAELVPNHGLGKAINDRLTRAAV
jgi:L-threonylcarbamoyladenylate synthase